MGLNTQITNLDHMQWSADALDRLTELRGVKDYTEILVERAVIECRTNAQQRTVDVVGNETREGATVHPVPWSKIGEALGISRQSAWERYAHLID